MLVAGDKNVAGFRVEHAVEELSVDHDAGPDARTDGEINDIGEAAGAAEARLTQAGHVGIGVIATGNIEALR